MTFVGHRLSCADAVDVVMLIRMASKTALVTGVSGQTGSYLAEHLLALGYRVLGLVRRRSTPGYPNLVDLSRHENVDQFRFVHGDMTDEASLRKVIEESQPDEIYNLAAQSFVAASWSQPMLTNDVNYLGFLRILEICRESLPEARIYQASSSEMFGNQPGPQDERTRMTPRSPYGVAKLAAHRIARVYRESFGMFVASGICFNHESPRRGYEFVTRKIAAGFANRAIYEDGNPKIKLGYIHSLRDWGYAPDYARAQHLMLQIDEPMDMVIATGESHSVREFLVTAHAAAGLDGTWEDHVEFDQDLYRPAEVYELLGDPSRASERLNWQPEVDFEELVHIMVQAELDLPLL